MRKEKLSLTLSGRTRNIKMNSFLRVGKKSLNILEGLEQAVSGGKRDGVEWVIVNLEMGSATVELEPQTESREDVTAKVIEECIDGLNEIENNPSSPPHFSDKMLKDARDIVGVLNDGIEEISISSQKKSAKISKKLASNVEELVISHERKEIGSLEGYLKMVTFKNDYFSLYDKLTGNRVKCDFDASREKLVEKIRKGLNRRVLVKGLITTNKTGVPQSAEVESIELFKPEEELPSLDDIVGLDENFTGGISSENYIDNLWAKDE